MAVLDVNLRGQHVRPIADALRDKGVPFVYTIGYASLLKEADWIQMLPC